MGTAQYIVIGTCLTLAALLLWAHLNGGRDQWPVSTPPSDRPKVPSLNARTIGLKMGWGAVLAMSIPLKVFKKDYFKNNGIQNFSVPYVITFVTFTLIIGSLAGLCLALKDIAGELRAKGEQVHWSLRLFFGSGILSVILCAVTAFTTGMIGAFLYSFLLQWEPPGK